jgi:hypothetical protein
MARWITIIILTGMQIKGYAQFSLKETNKPERYLVPATWFDATSKKVKPTWLNTLFKADKVSHHKVSSPFVNSRANSQFYAESYWVGTITTQSYNRGKIGTYYYWDVQGNLRESKFFLDIAGKNRRGLKLVFPRR